MKVESNQILWDAERNLRQRQFETAVNEFKQVILADPSNAKAYEGLGQSLYGLKRDDEAMVACQQAVEYDNNSVVAHTLIGSIYALHHQYEEAKTELEKAIKLNPSLAEPYISLGTIYFDQGNLLEAQTALQIALEVRPTNSLTYYNLSLVYSRQGDYDQAIRMAWRALRLNPTAKTGILLCLTYRGKHSLLVSSLLVLLYVIAFSLRSLITLPLMAVVLAPFLLDIISAIRNRKVSEGVAPLLLVVFLLCLYIYNLLLGPIL